MPVARGADRRLGGRRPRPRLRGRARAPAARLRGPPDAAGRGAPPGRRGQRRQPAASVRIFLKREDLCHTGAHKINNCLGQVLLARRMGKTRIIAETGAGQHGVATATACALFGLPCEVYMGAVDVERQALNVFRMKLLGAKVHPVNERHRHAQGRDERGAARLGHQRARHPLRDRLGGRPAPVPDAGARLPGGDRPRGARADPGRHRAPARRAACACVGGGSNAMGLFHAFVADAAVRLYGVEAAGEGIATGRHAATLEPGAGRRAARRALVRAVRRRRADRRGALDLRRARLPGRRPRARAPARTPGAPATWPSPTPRRWTRFQLLARTEGILPALESAHAIAALPRGGRASCADGAVIVVSLSGRGDKDMGTVAKALGVELPAMSRQSPAAAFARARAEKRKALVIYLTAERSRRSRPAAGCCWPPRAPAPT